MSVVSRPAVCRRRLTIRVVAAREVTLTPEVATTCHALRVESDVGRRLSRMRRTQWSASGLWSTLVEESRAVLSLPGTPVRMLKRPVSSLCTVTTAVVGRPVESGSEKENSKDRSTLVMTRQKRSGVTAASAPDSPAPGPTAVSAPRLVASGLSNWPSSTTSGWVATTLATCA